MLTITFKHKDYLFTDSLTWTLEKKFRLPASSLPQRDAGWLPVMVKASDEELSWIGKNFSGIPHIQEICNPIQTWRGSYAEFIYDHLPCE